MSAGFGDKKGKLMQSYGSSILWCDTKNPIWTKHHIQAFNFHFLRFGAGAGVADGVDRFFTCTTGNLPNVGFLAFIALMI